MAELPSLFFSPYHSSVDGHLGHFHISAIGHSTAMDVRVLISLQEDPASIILHKYPQVRLLDHTVALFLIFWGKPILFSPAVAPFCIPTNMNKGWICRFNSCLIQSFCYFFEYFFRDTQCSLSYLYSIALTFVFLITFTQSVSSLSSVSIIKISAMFNFYSLLLPIISSRVILFSSST